MSKYRREDPLTSVDFISAKDVLAYGSGNVLTIDDLLDRLPKRYEDRRTFDAFPAQAGGVSLCLRGMVVDTQVRRFGGRKQFYQAVVFEGGSNALNSNKITCRWFNMPWMKNALAEGHEVILFGRPKEYQGGMVMDHPDFEIVGECEGASIHLERIVPVYKGISGIPQRRLREHVFNLLEKIDSSDFQASYDLDPSYPRYEALREAHFPESIEQADAAKRYFALEEFFALQLSVVWKRARVREHEGRVLGKKAKLLTEFYHSLPFDLTDAQKRSVKEVLADMRAPFPICLLYTSPSPRDQRGSRMPSSA